MTNDASYAYDAEGRITTANGVTYTYDGNGLRVEKSSGKLYWRDIFGDTIAETDTTGSTTDANYHEYVFMAGRRIASRDGLGNVNYYYADALGSTVTLTDSSGNACARSSKQQCAGHCDVLRVRLLEQFERPKSERPRARLRPRFSGTAHRHKNSRPQTWLLRPGYFAEWMSGRPIQEQKGVPRFTLSLGSLVS